MCFNTDYDWYASQIEDDEGPAPEACHCCECGCRIKKGEWRRWVSMQEREDGIYCEPEKGEHVDDCPAAGCAAKGCVPDGDHAEDCVGEECEYVGPGETWEGNTCEGCHILRAALRTVEEDEGCHGVEAEPGLGAMYDEVGSAGGWLHYFDHFVRLGLHDAIRVMPEIDWDEYLEHLMEEGATGWGRHRRGGWYAGVYCSVTDGDPIEWFDLGGEA